MSENKKLRCAVYGAQTKPLYHVCGEIAISNQARNKRAQLVGELRYCAKCGSVKVVEK